MGAPDRPVDAGSGEHRAALRSVVTGAGAEPITASRMKLLVIVCSISGYAIAAAFIGALVVLDPEPAGHLLFNVGGAPVIALVWVFTGALFALAQLATAIRLPRGPDSGTTIAHAWIGRWRPNARYERPLEARRVAGYAALPCRVLRVGRIDISTEVRR